MSSVLQNINFSKEVKVLNMNQDPGQEEKKVPLRIQVDVTRPLIGYVGNLVKTT